MFVGFTRKISLNLMTDYHYTLHTGTWLRGDLLGKC